MARTPRVTDEQVEASKEIYRIAREEADVEIAKLRGEMAAKLPQYEAMGVLRKIQHDRAYNDLIEAVVLYRIKDNKAYRDGGLNWEDFCTAVNIDRRNADRIIDDIRPIFTSFSDNLSGFLGISFNKIRYLGKSIPDNLSSFEDGALVIQGEKIPLTPEHKDEIEAAIDKLQEDLKKQKEEIAAQQVNMSEKVLPIRVPLNRENSCCRRFLRPLSRLYPGATRRQYINLVHGLSSLTTAGRPGGNRTVHSTSSMNSV